MDVRRLADIRAGTDEAVRSSGSGYLVSPSLVLTVRHVLVDRCGKCAGSRECTACQVWPRIEVRLGHPGEGNPARTTAELCWQHPDDDLALLRIDPPPPSAERTTERATQRPTEGTTERVRWGSPSATNTGYFDFQGLGFPRLASYQGRQRFVEPLKGEFSGVSDNTGGYALNVTYAPDPAKESLWQGVSGAAIFSHGLLVAVASQDEEDFGGRRLRAVPAVNCVRDPLFAELIEADAGTPPVNEALEIVAAHYHPFGPLDEVAAVFGDESTYLFKPMRHEYLNGEIQARPSLVAETESRLRQGWCLVRGKGSTGKTTLAISVGLRHDLDGGNTYYATLKDDEFRQPASAILEKVAALSGPSTLLILDDVHLDEDLVGTILRYWRRTESAGKILLLGRALSERAYGTDGGGLAHINPHSVDIEVTEQDLLASCHRVIRAYSAGRDIADPDGSIVGSWRSLFGGELLAFIVALRQRIEAHGVRRWVLSGCRLEAGDPIEYIQDKYLDAWPEASGELVKLAACATVELTVPAETLDAHLLARPQKAGIVHSSRHGRKSYRRFSLVQAGLGPLIMEASPKADPLPILTTIAEGSAFFGFALAARLEALGKEAEATQVLRVLAADLELLTIGILPRWAIPNILRMSRLGVLSLAEIDQMLSSAPTLAGLVDDALNDLAGWAAFLEFAERRIPATAKRIVALLADPARAGDLADAISLHLGSAAAFLECAHRRMPSVVDRLTELLTEPRRAAYLADAIPSELGSAAAFLEYAHRRMPSVIHKLSESLTEPAHAEWLADAIPRDLGNGTTFLRYTEHRIPETAQQVMALLADPARAAHLADAIPSELGSATAFLEYAQRRMPPVVEKLSELLTDPKRAAHLADAIPNEPGNGAAFLEYADRRMPAIAEQVMSLLAEPTRAGHLADAIPNHLGSAIAFLECARRRMPSVVGQLSHLLAETARAAQLADNIPKDLGNATAFLEYAFRRIPETAQQVMTLLADPARAPHLADAVPRDLGNATTFLRYTEQRIPTATRQVMALLADRTRTTHLADAIPNNLGNATTFLEYADQRVPETAQQVMTLLADPTRATHLADAIPNNLGNATTFLEYADQRIQPFVEKLSELLAGPARASHLADAIPNNLGNGAAFLEYADRRMPPVAQELSTLLADPARTTHLADAIPNDLGNGAAFLEYADQRMPETARQIMALLTNPVRAAHLADAIPHSVEPALAFLQFAYAQMLPLAEQTSALLTDPRRAGHLADTAGQSDRNGRAMNRLIELIDLHNPDVAHQIETHIHEDG